MNDTPGIIRDVHLQREQACLQALKVHPGFPTAVRILFPGWVSQARWEKLSDACATGESQNFGAAIELKFLQDEWQT